MRKRILLLAAISLSLSANKAMANDIRKQYQQTEQRKQQAIENRAFAYENAQFLQGSDPNGVNIKYRIFISSDNVVYEVDEKSLKPIGRMDKLTKGCGFSCKMTKRVSTEVFLAAGEIGAADVKEEWQYFIEDGQLVKYTTTRVTTGTLSQGTSTSEPSTSRRVAGLPLSVLPAYRYKDPIRPFHIDNTGQVDEQGNYLSTGRDGNCMVQISTYMNRPPKCTQWEIDNPEIGFNLGKKVIGENGWEWCLDYWNGFLLSEEAERNGQCKGPLMVRSLKGEEIGVYTPGMIMASSYEEAQNNAMQARESEMRARERKNIEGQAGRFVDGLLRGLF